MANKYKTLVVLQPITGASVAKDFYTSAMGALSGNIQIIMATEYGVSTYLHVESTFPIDANRNRGVKHCMDGTFFGRPDPEKLQPADYIFMMDTDMVFPYNTLPQLMKTMNETGADLVSGMYFMKGKRFEPVMGRYIDKEMLYYKSFHYWDDDKPFYADVIGPGCVLVKRHVFEKIAFPWFQYLDNPLLFNGETVRDVSEDMHFCREVKKAGLKLVIDPQIKCGHIWTTPIGEQEFISFRDSYIDQLVPDQRKDWEEQKLDVRNEARITNGKA